MSMHDPTRPAGSGGEGWAYPPAPPEGRPYGQPVPYASGPGPVGKIRGTGFVVLLSIVTFGIYGLYWYYATHDEMKRHSGQGIGGVVALLLALFVGLVSPFLASSEVGDLYEWAGRAKPVSALTGLWVVPGFLLLVLPLVWLVKTNGALNAYWRSLGAR